MVPVAYNSRYLMVRWKTTMMTAAGFTLVVAAMIIMLAFVNGVEKVCKTSGEPENVIVLNKGNSDEVLSQLNNNIVTQVEHTDGVLRSSNGQPVASRELFMVLHHYRTSTEEYQFLQVRGVNPAAFDVHTHLSIAKGANFQPGQRQVIVGRSVAREQGLAVGDTLALGKADWKVAGIFEANGAAFESEVWCGLSELASQFRREGLYSTVVLRAADTEQAKRLANALQNSRTISVDAQTETAYYEAQAEQSKVIMRAALVITWFMGLGAVFGVMNTMFAAIGQRIKDIAVMRILGFRGREVLMSFLIEAILISVLGGVLGTMVGLAANGFTRTAAIGAREIEFAFHVDSTIVAIAMTFSIVMGIVGGLLPALSAMRVKPLEALR
jgi:ABC-type lipoprotein release transport system permease subunit